ncbi:MAG TPA: hypothetical protein VJZ26_13230, partial [Blastocatellia bacterium]|nr:hypothetical protein [Blastocatellia bacterium]
PDNRRDFPGGWTGDARNAFTSEGRAPHEREVFDHLKRVVRLRRELEPLRRGKLVTLAVADQQYAFARQTPRESVIVVFNNDSKAAQVEIDTSPLKLADGKTLGDRLKVVKDVRVDNAMMRVAMPARSASIFTVK